MRAGHLSFLLASGPSFPYNHISPPQSDHIPLSQDLTDTTRRDNGIFRRHMMIVFWLFMLAVDWIIPWVMILFGQLFLRQPPKNINRVFGYRTTMSMKNQDTWAFAHRQCGKVWFRLGILLLPLSALALLPFLQRSAQVMGTAGGIICFVQLLVMVCSTIPVELALRATFDASGRRKKEKTSSP